MITLYNILIFKTTVLLFFLKFFNKKIRIFVDQRKNVLNTLEKNISKSEKYIWIHVASLGEYEQGLPVFKELKKIYKVFISLQKDITMQSRILSEMFKDSSNVTYHTQLKTIINLIKEYCNDSKKLLYSFLILLEGLSG